MKNAGDSEIDYFRRIARLKDLAKSKELPKLTEVLKHDVNLDYNFTVKG